MSEVAVMPLDDYKNACASVRAKTGKTELITSGQLSAEIDSIKQGIDPSDATASIFDVVMGKTFYNAQGKQTGAIPILSGKQITPSTREQLVPGARYLGGDIVVLGEPNLLPENIPEDMTFFGVQGTRKMSGDTSYYDELWNLMGVNTMFDSAFRMTGVWNKKTWRPKTSIRPTSAAEMFRGLNQTKQNDAFDMTEQFPENETLDFSNCTTANSIYRDCFAFTRLGVQDFRKCSSLTQFAYNSKPNNVLKKIDKFMFANYLDLSMQFVNCTALTTVEFIGKLGARSCSLQYCPLDAPSVRSVISCLTNYAGTATEFLYSLKLHDTAWANVDADKDNPPPSGESWRDYVEQLGWNT